MNESDSFSNITNQLDENAINNILDIGINQVTLQSNKSAYKYKANSNTSSYRTMKNELASIQSNINKLEQKLFASTTSQSFPSDTNEQSNSSFFPSVDYKQKLATKENEMIGIKISHDEQLKTIEDLRKQIENNEGIIKEKNAIIQEQKKQIDQFQKCKEETGKMRNDYHLLLKEYNKSEEIRKEQKMIIKELQKDIDNMRQESLNRINQMKYTKDLIDIRTKHNMNYNPNDDIYTNKTNRRNNKSKSPSSKPNTKEKKCKKNTKNKY